VLIEESAVPEEAEYAALQRALEALHDVREEVRRPGILAMRRGLGSAIFDV
jgi:hypothetical protein